MPSDQPPIDVYVIANPTSGRGSGGRLVSELARHIENSPQVSSCTVALTTPFQARNSPSHSTESGWRSSAFELAQSAIRQGYQRVIAVGGDGTLHEVANALVGAQTVLGLIPAGTGNDFARSAGIRGSLKELVEVAVSGEVKLIDVGKVNDRYFLNVAGCGFDAVVADRINKGYRYLRGTSAYVAAVLRTLAQYKAAQLTITTDTDTLQLNAMLCAVANARFYGGGMMISPEAEMDDGLFDISVVKEIGKIGFLRAFPSVFKGTHVKHSKYVGLRAKRVKIESEKALPVLVDGELLGTTPVEFKIVPQALRIALPRLLVSDTMPE
ncbi:MAG: diacylglycerol kinase family lipid kinase [Fimbriimonadaceae bacterium]|nr:diacylglycerol kinase family lipid kinase [Fimbriimonadaceae bacterium]